MFKQKFINKKTVYYSDLIPEIEHFFTTREISVDDNFEVICKYLDIGIDELIHPTQTHSANVSIVTDGKFDYPETDALILTNFNQALYLRFADCTPVILYDKKANIGAIAHAGWRGTVGRIVPKTAKKMMSYTHSDINDIYAVIGPAIGGCCYCVGDEVIEGINKSVISNNGLFIEKSDGIYVDLKKVNSRQLEEMGVPRKNIDICPYCTSCRNDLFYSYRKENGTVYRHNAVIKLKENSTSATKV